MDHSSFVAHMSNPWLHVPADDYMIHMEHESVRQGEMIREHLAKCLKRFEPESLLYLGVGIGNGLECAAASKLRDILAVDVNPEYLAILRDRLKGLTALRTKQCSFPEEFSESGRLQLVYGALFFEYVDLESTLITIASHLTPTRFLVALLQQPSAQGQMTKTGVTSLEAILPIMSLHAPRAFKDVADRIGMFHHVSTEDMVSSCGKPFCEVTLQRA